MGIAKATWEEAMAYARERAQRLGSVQRIVEVNGEFRVGSENRMAFFYDDAPFNSVYPIF